ncbi:permease [Leptospira ryugenii]|uniref:Permease n=1 Tax=Leptospira ryugenii TaxID=1917863 RepID=A0A2P2E4R3_9LEPT|nr:DMT family transporter [Leptospira ryugenii]GBF51844.1 permease [Leptospira ryugenii]
MNAPSSKTQTLLELNVSVLIMGNVTLFAKTLPFHAITIIAGRAVFAFLLLLCFLKLRGKPLLPNSKTDFLKLFGIGILFGIHWVTYFHSIQISSVAIGMLSLFTYPVFTAILEPLFVGKKIDPFSFLLTCFAFLGLFFMVPKFDWSDQSFQGVVWGLFSAVIYSLRNILTKQMHVHYPSAQVLSIQLFASSILLLPFANGLSQMFFVPEYLLSLVVLAGVFTALAHTLWIRSIGKLPVVTVGLLSTVSPFYGTMSAWFFLGEVPPDRIWLGGGIILFCAVMEVIRTIDAKL